MSKQVSRSLSAQLLCGVLLSLLAASAVFFLCALSGTMLLSQTVYGKPFEDKMADRQFASLQNYVTQEGITTQNLHRLNAWCIRGKHVYLTIYRDGQILFESSIASEDLPAELDEEEFDAALENPDREYSLRLSDGTDTQAFLYYEDDSFFYLLIGLSGLAAFAVFSLCFTSLIHRKLRYVKQLKRELDILSGGDLSYPVTVCGADELGELAFGIDQMRRSIAAHQRAEEKMRSANSQLVTAMSHDLRTPMTSLLAYLELMERGKYENEAQLRHFISCCLEKTLRIKTMADQLFEYFLIYSSEWEQPELETADADGLFQQFWGEYAFSLESKGFPVALTLGRLAGSIRVNIELLRRVFDNLYSNLLKYADSAQPIEITCAKDKNQVRLSVVNRISSTRDRRESTNIGLNTCRKVIGQHGGTFSASETGGMFQVTISLPLENK